MERSQREQQAAQQAQMQELRKREQFREELAVALQHYPDLAQHRDGIMERLEETPGLSVESAYQLSTWQSLRKLAQDGEAAKKELQALRAKEKQTRAAATRPINGQAGVADARAITDPWEQAWQKAQLSLAQRSN
jgi:cell division protein FtsB